MSDTIQFKIEGMESLIAKLEGITYDLKRKGGRAGLRKSANVVAKALAENASRIDDPKSAADISKNVAVRFSNRTFKSTGDLKFRVGILGGAGGRAKSESLSGLPGGDSRHWRQQEFGNENHPAQPFARRALSENINQATETFVTEYSKSIDRAIKRAAKGKK